MGLNPLEELGRDIAREQDDVAADDAIERARQQLFAPRDKGRRNWALLTAVAAIAVTVLVLFVVPGLRGAPLSFEVEGQPGKVRTWIRANHEVPLRFSDGSSVVLRLGAHARVSETRPRGADLAIERGEATVAIEPRKDAQWTVAAGPYDVLVTGTRFDVAWMPDAERFRIVMHEGSVEVRGPTIEGVRILVAGQTLDEQRTVASPVETSSATPDAPPTAAPPTSAELVPSAAPTATAGPTWRELAAKGEFKDAWKEAEPQFGALLSSGSAADLASLADLARYAKQGARAQDAYRALRSRHAGTPQAARAAYSLGMMAFGGSKGAAVTWFQTYLSEAPGGSLAREALGRILEAQQGTAAAKGTARQYLQSYPSGPHAALAKSILVDDG